METLVLFIGQHISWNHTDVDGGLLINHANKTAQTKTHTPNLFKNGFWSLKCWHIDFFWLVEQIQIFTFTHLITGTCRSILGVKMSLMHVHTISHWLRFINHSYTLLAKSHASCSSAYFVLCSSTPRVPFCSQQWSAGRFSHLVRIQNKVLVCFCGFAPSPSYHSIYFLYPSMQAVPLDFFQAHWLFYN